MVVCLLGLEAQPAQHVELVRRRRFCFGEVIGEPQPPSGGVFDRSTLGPGMQARDGQLARLWIGLHDAQVGDHLDRPSGAQAETRAVVADFAMSERRQKIEPITFRGL